MLMHHALKMFNRRTGSIKTQCVKLIEFWHYHSATLPSA